VSETVTRPLPAAGALPAGGAPSAKGRPRQGTAAGRLRGVVRFTGEGLLATAHVSLDLWWGGVVALVLGALVSLGFSLVPVLLVGLVVLLGVLVAARAVAAVERARFAAVLGEVIPPLPPLDARGAWPRVRQLVALPGTWTAMVWVVVLPVLGLVWAVVVLGLWSLAAGLLTTPLWLTLAPPGTVLAGLGLGAVALAVLAGVLVAVAALAAARLAAAADVALARLLIGASPGQEQRRALTARVQTLTTTRADAVDAADAERRRIERDLHDGAQQRLVALALDLGMASAKLDDDPEQARVLVRRAHAEAKEALAELRELARGIHPAVLTDRGLDAALSALAARSPVPVSVLVDLPPGGAGRCSPTVEATAYFVVAEALTNVARHSAAQRASVTAWRHGDLLVVEVEDDGRGGADPATGSGLAGLRQRVSGVDGTLHLYSPPGGPTRLTVGIPCTSWGGGRDGR